MSDLAKAIDTARRNPEAPSLRMELERSRSAIDAALPDHFPGGAERFIRIVQTAVRLTPDLAKCTPMSIIGAAMQSAQLGLTPGVLGEAWLIPYKNGKTGQYEASFQVGWKGLLVLANRSRLRLMGATVHERDYFEWELGLEPKLRHKPARDNRGPAIYWYAVVRDADTGQLVGFAVVDREHVERRRQSGRSANSPAWRDWYDEMALTKAAREALRMAPLSIEMSGALMAEDRVRTTVEQAPEDMEAWEQLAPDAISAESGEVEPEAEP